MCFAYSLHCSGSTDTASRLKYPVCETDDILQGFFLPADSLIDRLQLDSMNNFSIIQDGLNQSFIKYPCTDHRI